MGPFIRNLFLIILCLLLPGNVFAWPKKLPKKDIALSFYTGSAPFTVRIIGPQELLSSAIGYPQQFGWCGYKVSWGDGASTDFYKEYKKGVLGSSCSTGLEHVYIKTGTFSIKVIKFHTGPTNRIVRDWIGRSKVVVNVQGSPLL